jgi:hypothetical protein
MVVRGHVQNGAVVWDEPVKLPEGAEVEVSVIGLAATERTEEEG